jgi:polysaccharide biosynthesis/export protein
MPASVSAIRNLFIFAFVFLVVSTSAWAQAAANGGSEAVATYEIGPEDVLDISVWKEKDLQREVVVRPDGWLTFPLVGNIQAAGRTPGQLENEIRNRLKKYIPDPVVTVAVKQVHGLKIFVIGKVGKPGEYMVGRYVDVLQALTLAGGLTPFADEDSIKIVRKQNGKETVIPFDYSQVKRGRGLDQNIQLKSGDVVLVP